MPKTLSKKLTDFTDPDGCNLSLPEFLFYENSSRSKSIGPHASFNPATAIDDEPWQSATSPSRQSNKKTIIIDSSTFFHPPTLAEVIAFIARMKSAGFKVLLKVDNSKSPFFEVPDDLKGLAQQVLNRAKFDPKKDPQIIAVSHSVAYERAIVLGYNERKAIQKPIEEWALQTDSFYGDDYHLNFRHFSFEEADEAIKKAIIQKGFSNLVISRAILFYLQHCSTEDAITLLTKYDGFFQSFEKEKQLTIIGDFLDKLPKEKLSFFIDILDKISNRTILARLIEIFPNELEIIKKRLIEIKELSSFKYISGSIFNAYKDFKNSDKDKEFKDFLKEFIPERDLSETSSTEIADMEDFSGLSSTEKPSTNPLKIDFTEKRDIESFVDFLEINPGFFRKRKLHILLEGDGVPHFIWYLFSKNKIDSFEEMFEGTEFLGIKPPINSQYLEILREKKTMDLVFFKTSS